MKLNTAAKEFHLVDPTPTVARIATSTQGKAAVHERRGDVSSPNNVVKKNSPRPPRQNLDEEAHARLNQVEEFPKVGISVREIIECFIPACGGWDALEGVLTSQVNTDYMIPMTKEYKCSWCEMLRKKNPNTKAVGRPVVFISHAWEYPFTQTVKTVAELFKDDLLDTIVWFDVFSINQHKASTLPAEWLRVFFKDAIGEIGHTVMVLSPWNDPVPYTRAWCVWEAFCTEETNAKFEIAMSEVEHKNFIKRAESNAQTTINAMLATIDAEKSTSFLKEDQDNIHSLIREGVGFAAVNSLLFTQLRKWVISVVKRELEMNQDGRRRARLLRMLGLLYKGQGGYKESFQLFTEALEICEDVYGPDHEKTLVTMFEVAGLHRYQGRLDDSERLYVECLDKMKSKLGADHPDTLATIHNLALVHESQGKFDDAERLYVECLNNKKSKLGADHPDTLTTINNLAWVHQSQGRLDDAERLYAECLDKRKSKLGVDHPDTLSTINNLAGVHQSQGRLDDAERLYVECLAKSQSKLGADHPDTLTTINNLAGVHHSQGRLDDAERLYVECVDMSKHKLGPDHPDTLATTHKLALVHRCQGRRLDDTERLYVECLGKRKSKLGADPPHPKTLKKSMTALKKLRRFKSGGV